jgi:DNA-binding CsgD family transcriptional regulator
LIEPIPGLLDVARLLFDLQQGNEITQSFSGCLDPEVIARRVTDGLVEKFDCAFARIWLLEPDKTALRLVASSGMYTHTNGAFARVPMGAFKVGKIAQNRVSFLSNNLADEPWVKDRDWAIAHNIRGFAGYPLTVGDKVVGVLATFSHQAMTPEFLEFLQILCTTVTVALENAIQHQQEKQSWQPSTHKLFWSNFSLSDQLASILSSVRLTLIGTEQPLTLPLNYLFLQAAEVLNRMGCNYCRLIYSAQCVELEAIIAVPDMGCQEQRDWVRSAFGTLSFTVSCLGGVLHAQTGTNQKVIQFLLKLPYPSSTLGSRLRIHCRLPVLQMAFTHLAHLAGLTVCDTSDEEVPLLSDELAQIRTAKRVLWLKQGVWALPKGVSAKIDLSISPVQLREAVDAVMRGETWGIESDSEGQPLLTYREQEVMSLLAQGLRDRDIANHLIISESTVKFHINNILSKLKARTRYQALHHAIVNGWIQ